MVITPAQMADIYFNRMHFSAINAVANISKQFPVGCLSAIYWGKVLKFIEEKAEGRNYGQSKLAARDDTRSNRRARDQAGLQILPG